MTKIFEIIKLMNSIAPEDKTLASYCDNVGLILGREEREVDSVLCCLDATSEVIDEAIELGTKLIISHHPFINSGIKRITSGDIIGSKILKAAENCISVYSAHTNLDIVKGGINDYVAQLIGLDSLEVMERGDGFGGLGRIGQLQSPTTLAELTSKIKNALEDTYLRVISRVNSPINRVAVINGGGGSIEYIDLAKKLGADCFVTADVKYHAGMYAADLGLSIIEPTHHAMERVFIKELVRLLNVRANQNKLDVSFLESQRERSPYIKI